MTTQDFFRIGADRLRVSRCRETPAKAVIHLDTSARPPQAESVAACVDRLRKLGITQLSTGALHDAASDPFLRAGFVMNERLRLLTVDLDAFEKWNGFDRPRRARGKHDELRALSIDHAAFPSTWQMDHHGLRDAIHATASHRFRILDDAQFPRRTPAGYLVCGRSGDAGYVQRLAVDPSKQRQGIATALVVDGLRWMRRHQATRAVVNTQLDNSPAKAFYEHLGFVESPHRLSILVHVAGSPPT